MAKRTGRVGEIQSEQKEGTRVRKSKPQGVGERKGEKTLERERERDRALHAGRDERGPRQRRAEQVDKTQTLADVR